MCIRCRHNISLFFYACFMLNVEQKKSPEVSPDVTKVPTYSLFSAKKPKTPRQNIPPSDREMPSTPKSPNEFIQLVNMLNYFLKLLKF